MRSKLFQTQMMGAEKATARLLCPWVGKAGLPESPREVRTLLETQGTFIDNIIAQLLRQLLMMIMTLLEQY